MSHVPHLMLDSTALINLRAIEVTECTDATPAELAALGLA